MLADLDHVGIAVESIENSLRYYRDVLGMRLSAIEEVASEKVKVAILYSGNTRVELLEATSDDSPIALFIQKRGPGIHHLAFSTPNILETTGQLRSESVKLIEPVPRLGAHGCQVGFIHPKESGGVLVEIVQRPK